MTKDPNIIMRTVIRTTFMLFGAGVVLAGLSGFAGDEQWDDRFATNHFDYHSWALTTYRGEVYSSSHRYDGHALTAWGNGNHFLYAMISDGQNLFGAGDFYGI